MEIQQIRFGIEIETVRRTREQVAKAIQKVAGGTASYVGYPQAYDPWQVLDRRGRKWQVVNDGSLTNHPSHLRAEVVSPVLEYGDLEELQAIVRSIRECGAKVDTQCGIHIHVDAAPFDGKSLGNLAKMVFKQEPLILHALAITENRLQRYTKPVSEEFIRKIEAERPRSKDHLNRLWYGQTNRQPTHYDSTRYHGVNLHNVWYRGTVEFRWFEATLHAGKIKAYIQFCLAIASRALNSRAAASRKRPFNPASAKYDFRVFLLRLGLIGDEFKTARLHLMKNMPGDAAFKQGRPVPVLTTENPTTEAGNNPGLSL